MRYVLQVVLSNAQHPEYGQATIPFPIPNQNYDSTIELLGPLEIGDTLRQDCQVDELDSFYTVLNTLIGTQVTLDELDYCLRCNPVPGDYQAYLTAFDLRVQRQNLAEQAAVIGRVTFASGEQQEYTDAETFLQCIRDELPNHPVTGFRYETLTDDPAIRKQVDDILYDLYGEENPRPLEDYENTPQEGMTMGGMT